MEGRTYDGETQELNPQNPDKTYKRNLDTDKNDL